MSLDDLREITTVIDVEIVFAPASRHALEEGGTGPSEPLYGEMAKMGEGWITLSGPTLHNGELVIAMARLSIDDDQDDPPGGES